MSESDPFPAGEEIRAANADLVALVPRRFPAGFYRTDTNWSLWSAALTMRMADTVEAAMRLMEAGHESDGRTLVRSLYEQVVTLAWIAIDAGPRYQRWFRHGLWDDLRMHNDAARFGIPTLSEEEVAITRKWLGLNSDADDAGLKKKRQPDSSLLLPPVPDRARESDEYWSSRISGLHPPGHALGFRGLYLAAFRTTSRSVHTSIGGLGVYVTEKQNRRVVHRSESEGRLMWALIAPLFGMGLVIAAQEAWWLDEVAVRELVDRATGPG
jgi:hypothetical protein